MSLQYCSIYVAKPYLSCSKGTLLFSFKYVNIQPVANSANSKTRNPIKAPRVIVAPLNGLLCSESIAVASSTKGVYFGSIEFSVRHFVVVVVAVVVTVLVYMALAQ